LAVISFGSSGTLNVKITYNYTAKELETRYRTETQYGDATKLVTIWSYLTKSY
jgi:hypothetical protein